MSLRRLLAIVFLLVSLVPALALTLLAFINSRSALLAEIGHNLSLSASAAASDIDKQLFERLLNATTWNHLEVMEDLRLGDIDKRLSRFLMETRLHHQGTYLALHALDKNGRVVASTQPGALAKPLPLPPPWMTMNISDELVTLFHPQPLSARSPSLVLTSRIDSQLTQAEIGTLVLEVDWQHIQKALDRLTTPSRQLLVIDQQARVAAVSSGLRAQGIDHGQSAKPWLPMDADARVETRTTLPGFEGVTLAGYARSSDQARRAGTGWTFVLLQPERDATAPVRKMAWVFVALMAALALIVLAVSLWIAGAISRPIRALTELTQRLTQPGPAPVSPPVGGPGEISELTRSFTRMVDDVQTAQRALLQASRLAALGEVTALLAHEIRTPLGILRSSAQLLGTDADTSSENRELLTIINSETQRLNRLVETLLDTTRARPLACTQTDLHALINHAIQLLFAQLRDRQIQIKTRFSALNPSIFADPEQLTQVLLNLLINAIQVLPQQGQIHITTADDPAALTIQIADSGRGIAEPLRSQIFEPFVFHREGGLGLGLAVVRSIVQAHHGNIQLKHCPTLGGALFQITLPRTQPTAPMSP